MHACIHIFCSECAVEIKREALWDFGGQEETLKILFKKQQQPQQQLIQTASSDVFFGVSPMFSFLAVNGGNTHSNVWYW